MTQPGRDAKSRLLARVQSEWSAFQDYIESLTEADHLLTGVVGDWSVRDLLVHITSWDGEALKAIPIILEVSRLPRYSLFTGASTRSTPWSKHLRCTCFWHRWGADMRDAHQRLLSCLAGLPSDALVWGGRLARRVRQDTWQHYREHTLHVVEWRQQKGLWRVGPTPESECPQTQIAARVIKEVWHATRQRAPRRRSQQVSVRE